MQSPLKSRRSQPLAGASALSLDGLDTHAKGATVNVSQVSHEFTGLDGSMVLAIDNVDFTIPSGQFVSLVGPSGCGKTTLLNMMAGLIQPSEGAVTLDGEACLRPKRNVGYMFARDGLLPWRTAQKNVEIGLEVRDLTRDERRQRSSQLLDLMGLGGFYHHYPRQLSQGMRQRVAIARTMAVNPSIFLMDEPFAALDAQTRVLLQNEFLDVWGRLGNTVVLVTHDLTEAVALADRVIVLAARPGRVVLDIDVPLPRPRDVETIRFDPQFVEVSQMVWDAMHRSETQHA